MRMTARILGGVGAAFAVLAVPAPAFAQDNDEARLRKIEAEVRALQRRVFPGGDARYFEPEISASEQRGTVAGQVSTTAVTDILARLDALEVQIQRLTGQVEENSNALRLVGERLDALEAAPSAQTDMAAAADSAEEATEEAAEEAEEAAVAAPPPGRLEAVQAIAKPQTDDAADDEYSYGFRLWDAGFYPEAQQQLTLFIEQYPDHWRQTYARNLLGRAYLDDDKPRQAAPWFLRNYNADKAAARAGDSLLFLSDAMIALDDTDRACIALAEFAETYPALAAGRLMDRFENNRRRANCD